MLKLAANQSKEKEFTPITLQRSIFPTLVPSALESGRAFHTTRKTPSRGRCREGGWSQVTGSVGSAVTGPGTSPNPILSLPRGTYIHIHTSRTRTPTYIYLLLYLSICMCIKNHELICNSNSTPQGLIFLL